MIPAYRCLTGIDWRYTEFQIKIFFLVYLLAFIAINLRVLG